MEAGWRTILRTVAITFVMTSVLWVGGAVWWYSATIAPGKLHRTDDTPSPANPAAHVDPNMGIALTDHSTATGGLTIPVQNIAPEQLVDTFRQSRQAGLRRHDAIDIMAPRGTPVVAAAAGKVEKLFLSDAGGKTVYVRSPDGRLVYYYAHLGSYDPSLAEGATLTPGTRIGTVGTTGNADPEAPHLHFAVWRTDPSRKWSDDAEPVNPYELLMQKPKRARPETTFVSSGAD
jgi:murein DD-endopeptidase MepM/ murein hydrolase activator NlpD